MQKATNQQNAHTKDFYTSVNAFDALFFNYFFW